MLHTSRPHFLPVGGRNALKVDANRRKARRRRKLENRELVLHIPASIAAPPLIISLTVGWEASFYLAPSKTSELCWYSGKLTRCCVTYIFGDLSDFRKHCMLQLSYLKIGVPTSPSARPASCINPATQLPRFPVRKRLRLEKTV